MATAVLPRSTVVDAELAVNQGRRTSAFTHRSWGIDTHFVLKGKYEKSRQTEQILFLIERRSCS